MIRFDEFEALGVAVCGMSEVTDDGGHATTLREALCMRCGVDPSRLARGRQVHGVTIATVTAVDAGRGALDDDSCFPDTDGLITAERGLPLAVLVADCVPVFLYDPVCGAGGLLHAGREGTFADIGGKAVEAMSRSFGSRPEDIHALIGPSAGPKSYEVSEDMAEAWRADGLPANGRYLDLWEANARQLETAGLLRDNVTIAGIDTITDTRFNSYRRDGTKARNVALLVL